MTAWIITIDAGYPQHLRYGFEDGFWDAPKRRGNIVAGDDLYFWQAGQQTLVGYAKARGALAPLTAEDPPGRWDDDVEYTHRVYLEPVSRMPVESVTWDDITTAAESGFLARNGINAVRTVDGQLLLKTSFLRQVESPGVDGPSLSEALGASLDFQNRQDRRDRRVSDLVYRRGQARFRERLILAYGGRCALSEAREPAPLEAAHILSYRGAHSDDVRNGLLLRVDLHRLFDRCLLGIDGDLVAHVHDEVREAGYDGFHGSEIHVPTMEENHPSVEALRWHWKSCDWLPDRRF